MTFWAKSTRERAPRHRTGRGPERRPPVHRRSGEHRSARSGRNTSCPSRCPPGSRPSGGSSTSPPAPTAARPPGFTFWLANIQYVTLGTTIGGPHPVMPSTCVRKSVGDGSFPAFRDGHDSRGLRRAGPGRDHRRLESLLHLHLLGSRGRDRRSRRASGVQGNGTATVTAQLGGIHAAGPLTVKVGGAETCPPLAVPTDIAPTPTVPAENVISLFGTAYPARPVDSWHTSWSDCCSELHADDHPDPDRSAPGQEVRPVPLQRRRVHRLTAAPTLIDASAMTWFHIDVWTPNGYAFDVKLVNDPAGFAVRVHRALATSSRPAPGPAWRSP